MENFTMGKKCTNSQYSIVIMKWWSIKNLWVVTSLDCLLFLEELWSVDLWAHFKSNNTYLKISLFNKTFPKTFPSHPLTHTMFDSTYIYDKIDLIVARLLCKPIILTNLTASLSLPVYHIKPIMLINLTLLSWPIYHVKPNMLLSVSILL